MNAREHFEEAERLLRGPEPTAYNWDQEDQPNGYAEDRADNLATALVHAILALGAATNAFIATSEKPAFPLPPREPDHSRRG